jgi:hypothetical protein
VTEPFHIPMSRWCEYANERIAELEQALGLQRELRRTDNAAGALKAKELEQERDKYKWQRDEALAEHCAMVEHEYGISHWPTEEQPPTLDDWLDDDEAVAKWVAEKVADLDRRWEGRS